MRVRVEAIPAAGKTVVAGLEDGWAREAAAAAVDAEPEALEARLRILPVKKGRVTIEVTARATHPATCDRCGEPLSHVVETEVALTYLPTGEDVGRRDDDEGVELAEDDLDLGWYEDGSLVLADVLTEALALATPSRTVCEDTAGCDARTESLLAEAKRDTGGHPAFAALKNLQN